MPKFNITITQEQRERIEKSLLPENWEETREKWRKIAEEYDPLIEEMEAAIRRTETLSAKDYMTTINARDWQ